MHRLSGDRFVYNAVFIGLAAMTIATAARAESGMASYYSGQGHRHRGEMTCAHRTRPFGSMITVNYAGRSIRCRVTDRGPFIRGRVVDISISAARALGIMQSGVVLVTLDE
jgi:rare lipoprotein A